ncbi:hypothetical protein SAMN05428988_5752 [Chitinophaga sp. YR573]|uniref:hypothetical protein n=1 Tax=Chitinophaga sp. YR573 TaxID=1881040 RepID=UPI0008BC0500|nr:hypothetical protein [Chitinophaga sp. YR573]SEW44376.1 hypothetical protein SAMN05428988_5752 [Chitinophaga sp. YR573]
MMNFPEATIVLSHVPILLTVVYAAICYKQLGKELKVFSWFIFLSGIIQFTSLGCWYASKNNMPLLHIYVATGFICLAWFYQTLLKGFIKSKIIWLVAILFLIFTIINSLFFQSIFTFNSNALTVESILIIILALFTYRFFLNDIVKETSRYDIKSLNWINSGLFIYYSSSMLIFYFGSVITSTFTRNLNLYTWVFHSFFSIVMYTCFFIGLWKRSKT